MALALDQLLAGIGIKAPAINLTDMQLDTRLLQPRGSRPTTQSPTQRCQREVEPEKQPGAATGHRD